VIKYPDIDPVAIAIGPLKLRWYGIMYLIGFWAGWWLARVRARRPGSGWRPEEVTDLLFYVAVGVVIGGRVGSILFYHLGDFLSDPLVLFKIWQGGMSFHGGFLGVMVGVWLFAHKTGRNFWDVTDFFAPVCPPGLMAGRLGNFINGELWGKATDLPWGMQLSCERFGPYLCAYPRHPSQLYEALLEGVVLFTILWWYSSKPRPRIAVSGMFLLCYGVLRTAVEFLRLPDAHIGYLAWGWLTMGQLLSIPMILVGIAFLVWAGRGGPGRKRAIENES
jgi:phosphatidylglycerol:prolipoprotein diacylglycerol transferase